MNVKDRIMDALDVEGFLLCKDEKEAREIVPQLMKEMGFSNYEIVSMEFNGPGTNIRVRAYMNKPGDSYTWLKS